MKNSFMLLGDTRDEAELEEPEVMEGYPIKIQVNHVRPWIFSFVDSLFHKGLRSVFSPPALPKGDARRAAFFVALRAAAK